MTNKRPLSDSAADLRRRAEELARAKSAQLPESLEGLSPQEAQRLLHELRVHQIELEMQNEELRRTREAVEASRARYLDLYDLAPVGYLTLSAKGLILEANLTAATLFGMAKGALARQRLTHFILHEDQDICYLHLKRLLETGAPQVCELRMLRPDGDQFWARLEASVAQDADGTPVCRVVVSDITVRKRAEETLRASEQKYRLLIENTHDIVYTCGLDGVLTFASPSWTVHLGHPVAQVIGKSFRQFVHPDDVARCQALLEQAAKAGQRQSGIEYRVQHADGSWRWHTSNAVPVRDEAGALIGFEGIASDITGRVLAERAVQENQAHLRALIENTVDRIWAVDADCRFIIGNASFTTGVEVGQGHKITMGESALLDGVPQTTQDEWRSYYDRALHGESFSVEIETHFFGQPACIDFRFHPIREADGTISGVVVSGHDVTTRKRAEQASRESEERFRLLVENAPDALVVHTHFRFAYLNPAAVRLYGAESAAQLLGTPVLERVDSGGHDLIRERMQLLEVGKTTLPFAEQTFLRMDGSPVPVEVSTVPIHWNGDDGALVFVRDLTMRRQAEQERLEMERRLLQSQKLESLGVLAGGIAHDFNNLLMALLGNLELATEELSPVSSARPRVEQAVLAARRAADLTRQMLAYSGKGHFDVRCVDLNELVEENAHMLRAAVSRNLTFNLHLNEGLPPILADAGQIQQVVMNLITNASEAIGQGPGIVALATGAQACDADYLSRSLLEDKPAPGEFVWLEVTDSGCGMDAETLQRMFEPFFTTKFTGRGLGMSAVHGIVRGHQGAILAETTVGGGTTIRVLFPAAERTAAQPRTLQRDATQPRLRRDATQPRLRRDATQPRLQQDATRLTQAAEVGGEPAEGTMAPLLSGTVLVVDDEPMVCDVFATTLTGLGLQVLTATDGAAAMAEFREHGDEITCVLLDLTMPRMDGAATFECMRSIRPDVRVILCSGYEEQEATRRFAGRGLAGFLQKPFQLKDLRAELVRVLK